ncbi:MAG TPA: arginine--tRNA ligase [Candidatus Paceibacterota bacterium]|nr:arginine--tRNA ligase [Candidatus Paceibacterota bacterium]
MFKQQIQNLVYSALKSLAKKGVFSQITLEKKSIEIETQFQKEKGDYSSNIAFSLAKQLKQSPQAIAQKIQEEILIKKPKFLKKIEEKNGFLNFFLEENILTSKFLKVESEKLFSLNIGKNQKVIIEFSSPNIAKPMHVGHLRSTIIGDCLANLFSFSGYQVIRWNYLGDWGTQFGKLITAYKLWGKEEKIKKDPVNNLLNLYQRFHSEVKKNPQLEKMAQEEFKKLEDGDKENTRLFQWFSKESSKEFQKIYRLFKIKFDVIKGESFFYQDQEKIIEELKKKKIVQESEGALIIDLKEFNLPPALILKSDEAGLYLTRDLCALIYRVDKYQPKMILYVVGNEQDLHFRQLFAVFQKIRKNKVKLVHVKFGLVLNEKKEKFSTREGELIPLKELIDKAIIEALKILNKKQPAWSKEKKQKIAEKIAISSLKFNNLKTYRLNDIIFDWERMMSFQGDSSVYLQYTFARFSKILAKSKLSRNFIKDFQKRNQKIEVNSLEKDIIKKIIDWPDIIISSVRNYAPNILANYLLSLADLLNQYYETTPVLQEENLEQRHFRLYLIEICLEVFTNGFNLLGIETLKEI